MFFYSGDCSEPRHVHVANGKQEAKVWVDSLTIARVKRMSGRDVEIVRRIVRENRAAILEVWRDHCGD